MINKRDSNTCNLAIKMSMHCFCLKLCKFSKNTLRRKTQIGKDNLDLNTRGTGISTSKIKKNIKWKNTN